ncbi:capsule assembly Wzi family protein [Taibaiella koreensis]|uniref:capsule assembly Wzi family protein n=1 Tax=Taibaiella koreensis TaxID=1268548 RepID=UPI000E59958F|nr:capsule assembly Wzi family protein [Taibaiella koreensis]
MQTMIKRWALLVTLACCAGTVKAQAPDDTAGRFHYGLSVMAIGASNGQVPFWMRSNQYGSIPLDGVSGSLSGYVFRDYKERTQDWKPDWGGAVEARTNLGNRAQLILVEAYLKARLNIFEIKAGRSRDRMGLVDSNLSSGAFSVSGNALGIPKLELSIPDYWKVPFTNGVLSIKGNFAIGYIGSIGTETNLYMPGVNADTWYHQKSFYGRLGKDSWKVKLYGGFNHQVFWGDENRYYHDWDLAPLPTAFKALTGTTYHGSKVGNHLGSIDQGIEIDLSRVKINAYHQFFYDVGGLYHLSNIKDGLWGLSLTNGQEQSKETIGWQKVLVEFLYTKSQGGEPNAKITPSGDENYYNGMYTEGWTYQQQNLGSPLLTNRQYMRAGLPHGSVNDYIVNNRVMAFHAGIMGNLYRWSVTAKATYSLNYGTWGSSPFGHSGAELRSPGPPPYFTRVKQFSGYIEASRPLKNGFRIGFALAGDQGGLLYNSIGGLISLSKGW